MGSSRCIQWDHLLHTEYNEVFNFSKTWGRKKSVFLVKEHWSFSMFHSLISLLFLQAVGWHGTTSKTNSKLWALWVMLGQRKKATVWIHPCCGFHLHLPCLSLITPKYSRNNVCWQPIQHHLLESSHPPASDTLFTRHKIFWVKRRWININIQSWWDHQCLSRFSKPVLLDGSSGFKGRSAFLVSFYHGLEITL